MCPKVRSYTTSLELGVSFTPHLKTFHIYDFEAIAPSEDIPTQIRESYHVATTLSIQK